MVKKLFKHEFLAWLRISWVVAAVVMTVAGAHRLLQLFESDSPIYVLINVMTLLVYALTLFGAMCFPTVYAVVRFYKNLFTGEGYLSFTLPVTPTAHLWVKSLTATAMSVAVALVCLLSGMLITAGDVFSEVCKLIGYYFDKLPADQLWHYIGVGLEMTVLLIVSAFGGHMVYYTCICAGQLFRKHRLVMSVVVFFAYYYVTQIFSIILGVVMEVLEMKGTLNNFYAWCAQHYIATTHISLLGSLALNGILAVACFLVCRWVMTRKLNLE